MCVRKTVFLIPVPKNSLPEPKNFREHCHKSTPHTQTHTDTQRQRTHTQPPRVSTSRACSTRLALIAKNVSLRRASAPCPHAASCVVTLSPSLSFVCVGSVTQRVEHMVSVHFFRCIKGADARLAKTEYSLRSLASVPRPHAHTKTIVRR
jgi:hypothetical protein